MNTNFKPFKKISCHMVVCQTQRNKPSLRLHHHYGSRPSKIPATSFFQRAPRSTVTVVNGKSRDRKKATTPRKSSVLPTKSPATEDPHPNLAPSALVADLVVKSNTDRQGAVETTGVDSFSRKPNQNYLIISLYELPLSSEIPTNLPSARLHSEAEPPGVKDSGERRVAMEFYGILLTKFKLN